MGPGYQARKEGAFISPPQRTPRKDFGKPSINIYEQPANTSASRHRLSVGFRNLRHWQRIIKLPELQRLSIKHKRSHLPKSSKMVF